MYRIITEKPLALDSMDYKVPCGVKNDNTKNEKFVSKIISIALDRGFWPVKYLDLGCAGGGLVKQFFDLGNIAIGVDGSNYRQVNQLPEWNTIPYNLFTADITSSFSIFENTGQSQQKLSFDIISLWEVMEHIKEEDIPNLINNIKNNLRIDGYLMVSISKDQQIHHVNIKEFDEWDRLFQSYGFERDLDFEKYIDKDWPRGPHQSSDSGSPTVLDNCRYIYRIV